jgi:uncharacterized membrane protein (UPF0127 family)
MKTGFISINNNVFSTLLALSEEEQSRGLMFIEPPAPNMVFIYNKPGINKFWMKNTPSPLDIIFCYKNKISQIHYGEPYSTQIIGDEDLSDLIVEVPHGTVSKLGIKIGDSIDLFNPSFNDLESEFFKKRG